MPIRSPLFTPEGLPPLTPEACTRVDAIVKQIRARMTDGSIAFADYMEMALYTPGLGYYSGGLHKFGAAGDFVTAPEISPLFGRCVARQLAEILAILGQGEILEAGAGSGALAVEILRTLEELGVPPQRYLILELSGELRARQREAIMTHLPQWLSRVEWLTDLPTAGWVGVVIANEFLDALPVHRFTVTAQGPLEQRVAWDDDGGFTWCLQPPTGYLASALEAWSTAHDEPLANGYTSELALAAPAWLTTMAERLGRGGILLIDYGYPDREYYHPLRDNGTLVCHYRHLRHDDPLILPGLQDITAHVNFSALAEAAVAVGLTIAGYTTQAHFLMATGISDIFSQMAVTDTQFQLALANQIRILTLPHEMGEFFKVLAVTRGLDQDLMGFQNYNWRSRL